MNWTQRISGLTPGQRKLLMQKLEEKKIDILQLPIPQQDRSEIQRYPLSFAQERLWLTHQLDAGNFAYNILCPARLEGHLDKQALERAVNEIVRRHETLRTIFILDEGQDKPVQLIQPRLKIPLTVIASRAKSREEQEGEVGEFIRGCGFQPFDLARGPLLRVFLLELEEEVHIFLLAIHHIIADGTSIPLFIRELELLYGAIIRDEPLVLPEPPVQYVDFVIWQRQWYGDAGWESGPGKKQESYWLEQFSREIPAQALPTDYPQPPVKSFEGSRVTILLESDETGALKRLAQRQGTSLYVVLLAIYNIFLSRLGGMEDIVVVTPVTGRRHPGVKNLIGMFVNTVALRNFPHPGKTVASFMREVGEVTLKAYENQEYRYEDIVEKIKADSDSGPSPLLDLPHSMILDNVRQSIINLPGIRAESYEWNLPTARYDMELIVREEGNRLEVTFEYCKRLFKPGTIERYGRYFIQAVRSVVLDGDVKISQIEMIPQQERDRIVNEFNATTADYPREKTIHELFLEQAVQTPDCLALLGLSYLSYRSDSSDYPKQSYLSDQSDSSDHPKRSNRSDLSYISITYRELNERSGQLAGLLKEKGVKPDIIVGIMVERSIEMLIGIFGILKAGGAYLPIDPEYPQERINYMLADSRAKILVTDGNYEGIGHRPVFVLDLIHAVHDECEIQKMGKGSSTGTVQCPVPTHSTSTCPVGPANLAYVIYTSGSTGKPKGVSIEHRNVINFIYGITARVEFKPGKVILALTTLSFDIFVLETLVPLVKGIKIVIAAETQQKDPQLLAGKILKEDIDMLQLTPSSLRLLALGSPGLSCLKGVEVVMVGGEPFPRELLDELQTASSARILNLYGPTETTVWSAVKDLTGTPGAEKISLGTPIANTQIYILGGNKRWQPIGIPGELVIGGDGIARGYLNNPGLTAERFILPSATRGYFRENPYRHPAPRGLDPAKLLSKKPSPHSPYSTIYKTGDPPAGGAYKSNVLYRTGDLARWNPAGEIEFIGRTDTQVKIRGYRIELGEIETRLLASELVKEAVVMVKTGKTGDNYLCAYLVPIGRTEPDTSAIREFLAGKLPGYMIPAYFVFTESIPLTPNGKVDRKALPEPGHQAGGGYMAPRDRLENRLEEIWSEVLGIERERIGIGANFFRLGGHSLKAAAMVSKVHRELGVMLPLTEVFKTPEIMGLSKHIREMAIGEYGKYLPLELSEKKEYYALSSAQRRLYVLQQMDLAGTAYNVSLTVILEGNPDREQVTLAFKKSIRRHESLRTSFHLHEAEPVQKIQDEIDMDIELPKVFGGVQGDLFSKRFPWPPEAVIRNFIRPFDLSRAPLLRVGLIKLAEEKHLLMVDMHHIITDGVSMQILIREFALLYAGKSLPLLKSRYKDYARWQNSEKQQQAIRQQEAYWINRYAGEIPVLELPYDNPRPTVQDFSGDTVEFALPRGETKALKDLAVEQGGTLYMVLLAVTGTWLYKLSNQENLVVGIPTSGRRHAELENLVGMFVNTLALRIDLEGGRTFGEFLTEVKERTLQAFENQDYPLEELVEKISLNRDASRNPLFDTVFALQETGIPTMEIPTPDGTRLNIKPYKPGNRTSKFDIGLIGVGVGDTLFFTVEYCTKLFRKETIRRYTKYFQQVVTGVIKDRQKKISQIEIITEEEREQVLWDFNRGGVEYPREKSIHELYAVQAEQAPDHVALHGLSYLSNLSDLSDISITYRELNEKSERLRGLLVERGIEGEAIVGIMAERSVEMIVGILGILKAGAAYLPINPQNPGDRIRYMLADSRARLLVCGRNDVETGQCPVPTLDLVHATGQNNRTRTGQCPVPTHTTSTSQVGSANLAYVIYTSGTTGKPKAVMVQHFNVVRLVKNTDYVEFRKGDRILQTGALEFDASTFEIWGSLLNGLELTLVSQQVILASGQLKETIRKNGIGTIWLTSSLFNQLLEVEIEIFRELKNLLVGGDVLSPTHINRLRSRYPRLNIINGYGPTENTTFSTTYMIDTCRDRIPIGKPIANSTAYIVNKNGYLQPVGVVGELWVGGEGIARGYLNNPELTAEKFRLRRPEGALFTNTLQKFAKKTSFCFNPNVFTNSDAKSLKGWGRRPLFEKTAPPGPPRKNFSLNPTIQQKVPGKNHGNSPLTTHHSPLYQTGDLARWLDDGNIEFLGRMDHQVKIRGHRIELGEIEVRLLKYPGIKEAVVLDRKDEIGDKYLCAWLVAGKECSTGEIRQYLAGLLPGYMVPDHYKFIEKIPLTVNGKVDRKSLPAPGIEVGKGYIAPRDKVEEKLVEIWSEVLGIDKGKISIDADFFRMGGHSLKATVMIAKIHRELNAKLPLAEVFKTPDIMGLSRYIREMEKGKYVPLEFSEKKEYYALSSAQRRLYVLQQMDLGGTVYNVPMASIIEGNPDRDQVAQAFKKSIRRHESLRTSFHIIENEPVQRIHECQGRGEVPSPLTEVFGGVRGNLFSKRFPWPPEAIIRNFIRPFDLSKVPLLRVGLTKLAGENHLLIVDMHHIITDGTSMRLLMKEIMTYYAGEELSPLKFQYKEYVQWQNSPRQEKILREQEQYWLRQFIDEEPVLELPLDYSRPAVQRFEGGTVRFEIAAESTRALNRLALETGATLFIILLAIYNVLLSKLSGQEEIVIGTPIAGRRHADLEPVIGMFVNTLALKNHPGGDRAFPEFLRELKQNTLQAFENQEYPFEDLAEKVLTHRDVGRNPIFDTMFTLQEIEAPAGHQPSAVQSTKSAMSQMKIKPLEIETGTAKFDLELTFINDRKRLTGVFGYCTTLFKEETIRRFIHYFEHLVTAVVHGRGKKISQLEIISGRERDRILYEFNETAAAYPGENLPWLFGEQVEHAPDRVALVGPGADGLTYRELNERSGRLAGELTGKGIEPETIVGIMIESSIETIIGILAIIKAGGAYLPIAPGNPGERVDYMLADSAAKILVSDRNDVGTGRCPVPILDLIHAVHGGGGIQKPGIEQSNSTRTGQCPVPKHSPVTSLAYVIYTSGTTGKPKGVMVKHQNVVRLVKNVNYIALNQGERLLMTGSIGFDIATFEIWAPLLDGMTLYLVRNAALMNAGALKDVITLNRISILHLVPQLFNRMAGEDMEIFAGLRYFLVGGDLVRPVHINRLREKYPRLKILHMYGPTENTTFSTFLSIERAYEKTIPLGKPVSNSTVYILGRGNELLPIGAVGELCVGGDGVARGYLNNPELTAEKFIDSDLNSSNSSNSSNRSYRSHMSYTIYKKLYKTGDLARWNPAGEIEFLGRRDTQVKLLGIRVELGEIESRLSNHPGIKEAAVLPGESKNADRYLCAYVVPRERITTPQLREYLSGYLPGSMIPAYFVFLERLPLTPNGKVDRRALPVPVPGEATAYVQPGNEIEKKLVEIWSEILEIEKKCIGIETDFFQLGGHSLKASRMISKVNAEFNLNIPLVEVFKNPYIRAMGEYIREAGNNTGAGNNTFNWPAAGNNLVLLKQGAGAGPLFFFHDGTGEVEGYIELCNHICAPFDCWGIRANSLENYAPVEISIREAAAHYIRKIKVLQPVGPYFLAGWSLGGIIAFEVARQLEERGEKIAFLASIDAPLHHNPNEEESKPLTVQTEIEWVSQYLPGDEIKEKIAGAGKVSQIWSVIADYLEENNSKVEIIKHLHPGQWAQIIPGYDRKGIKELIYYLNMNRTFTRAQARYQPTNKINTVLHYFKARQTPPGYRDSWKAYCRSPVRWYEISGDHYSIMKEPAVHRIGKIFDRILP